MEPCGTAPGRRARRGAEGDHGEQPARGALRRPVHSARRQRGIPLPVRRRRGGPQAVPAPARPRCTRRGRPLGFRRLAQRERSDRVPVTPGARRRQTATPRRRYAPATWPPATGGTTAPHGGRVRLSRPVDLAIVPCGIPPGRKAARPAFRRHVRRARTARHDIPTPESRAHPWPTSSRSSSASGPTRRRACGTSP